MSNSVQEFIFHLRAGFKFFVQWSLCNYYFVDDKPKRRISKRVLQENKTRQIFKKKKNENFLPPDTHTNVYVSSGEKCLFFGRFCVLCFLVTPVLRFFLLLYYRQFMCTFFYKIQRLYLSFTVFLLEKFNFEFYQIDHTNKLEIGTFDCCYIQTSLIF